MSVPVVDIDKAIAEIEPIIRSNPAVKERFKALVGEMEAVQPLRQSKLTVGDRLWFTTRRAARVAVASSAVILPLVQAFAPQYTAVATAAVIGVSAVAGGEKAVREGLREKTGNPDAGWLKLLVDALTLLFNKMFTKEGGKK